jgi:DNA-binding winged helix-turn-helix (wHTH) protein
MDRSELENPPARFVFGRFLIDRDRRCLLIDGREVTLRRETWMLLDHLARRAPRVVSREELLEAIWPGLLVTDETLASHIAELRRTFGEAGAALVVETTDGFQLDTAAAPPERRRAHGVHPLRWHWKYGIVVPLVTMIVFLVIWWFTRDAA